MPSASGTTPLRAAHTPRCGRACISNDRLWPEGKKLPECTFIGLFYDTAVEEEEINDPSAMTAWGVFESTSKKGTGEEYNHNHVIMLGAWEEHVEAVALPDIIGGNKHDNPA